MQASDPGQRHERPNPSRPELSHAYSAHLERTRAEESWVEIDSQRSSSSLSSVADEIVTTGLRVHDVARRRRRPRHQPATSHILAPHSASDLSSQEEYDESESESDRVMTSSNEGLDMAPLSDEDESRTAVNYPIRSTPTVFTPQPNAFSHPPHSYTARHASEPGPGGYFPPSRPTAASARQSFSTPHRAAAQHEAALRASLSTLLSCAAAARALPKTNPAYTAPVPAPRPSGINPTTLRLVPESALPGVVTREPTFVPTLRPRSNSTTSSLDGKRHRSKDRGGRAKKVRRSASSATASTVEEEFVSPTLLTWVVSAGVVVALSAISFTAGYAVGREAGRLEGVEAAGGCSVEAARGLGAGRLRLTTAA